MLYFFNILFFKCKSVENNKKMKQKRNETKRKEVKN